MSNERMTEMVEKLANIHETIGELHTVLDVIDDTLHNIAKDIIDERTRKIRAENSKFEKPLDEDLQKLLNEFFKTFIR